MTLNMLIDKLSRASAHLLTATSTEVLNRLTGQRCQHPHPRSRCLDQRCLNVATSQCVLSAVGNVHEAIWSLVLLIELTYQGPCLGGSAIYREVDRLFRRDARGDRLSDVLVDDILEFTQCPGTRNKKLLLHLQ